MVEEEDKAQDGKEQLMILLIYIFKALELISSGDKQVIEVNKLTTLPYINFVNYMYEWFST